MTLSRRFIAAIGVTITVSWGPMACGVEDFVVPEPVVDDREDDEDDEDDEFDDEDDEPIGSETAGDTQENEGEDDGEGGDTDEDESETEGGDTDEDESEAEGDTDEDESEAEGDTEPAAPARDPADLSTEPTTRTSSPYEAD